MYVQYRKDQIIGVVYKMLVCKIHDNGNQTKQAWVW